MPMIGYKDINDDRLLNLIKFSKDNNIIFQNPIPYIRNGKYQYHSFGFTEITKNNIYTIRKLKKEKYDSNYWYKIIPIIIKK